MDIFIDPLFCERYYREFPVVLMDIGASGGLSKTWRRAQRYLRFIGFEPDQRAFVNLAKSPDPQLEYWNTGLYREKAVLDFYLTSKQEVSSLFKPHREFLDEFPEPERFDIVETTRMQFDTLDNQLQQHRVSDVDFIKVDTQGSELAVLEGSRGILASSVFGLEVEAEFSPIYQGQPLFSDLDSFVRQLGFQLFDLRGGYWKRDAGKSYGGARGQLIFADALYFRSPQSFEQILSRIDEESRRKSKLLRAVSVCILYGYLDYALELFGRLGGDFSAEEIDLFRKKIREETQLWARLPYFPGRGKISALLYALHRMVRPSHKGWAVMERELGNF